VLFHHENLKVFVEQYESVLINKLLSKTKQFLMHNILMFHFLRLLFEFIFQIKLKQQQVIIKFFIGILLENTINVKQK